MQNYSITAKEIIRDIITLPVSKATEKLECALNEAYNLGKKHLHEPAHLMSCEHKPTIERDTFNPIH